jgi:hypothetical protein
MTDSERLVWAAAFAATRSTESAMLAVDSLRYAYRTRSREPRRPEEQMLLEFLNEKE